MLQPLADTFTRVEIKGNRFEVENYIAALRERTQSKINERTQVSFTQIQDELYQDNGDNTTASIAIERRQIRGNHKHDVVNLLKKTADKLNYQVTFEIVAYMRNQTEKLEKPVVDKEQ